MIRIIVMLVLLLIASVAGAASNVLLWDDASTNETTFHIERKAEVCTGAAAFAEIATAGANVVTYTDLAVTEGQAYCYQVAASNSAGKSAYSNTAVRVVPFTVPAVPTNLRLQ